MNGKLFLAAYPYQQDVLALPVKDIEVAARWYSDVFGMSEIQRQENPYPSIVLERDGVEIGFSVNGGDASQDGAAIQVSDIHRAKSELETKGVTVAKLQIEERDEKKFHVFFVVAPDGLCYYFHQQLNPQE